MNCELNRFIVDPKIHALFVIPNIFSFVYQSDAGWEEYYDYIFPEDAANQPNLKLLAMAKMWKKQQQDDENEQEEEEEEEDEEGQQVPQGKEALENSEPEEQEPAASREQPENKNADHDDDESSSDSESDGGDREDDKDKTEETKADTENH